MLITVVAVLVQLSTGYTVEKVVTDSDQVPGLTLTGCAIFAQQGISEWMMQDPKYKEGWRLDRYKCIPGHYEAKTIL